MPDFRTIFESAPHACLVLHNDPNFTIVAVNDAYLHATRTERESILGRPFSEAFSDALAGPPGAGVDLLSASLETVRSTRQPHALPSLPYPLRPSPQREGLEERFWRVSNTPVLSANGSVEAIVHAIEEVTPLVRLERLRLEQQQANDALQARIDAAEREIASRREELAQTRRELAEQRKLLRETRVRLDAAVTTGEVATWVWEIRADRVDADESLARWFALSPGDERHSLASYVAAVHPEDVPGLRQRIIDSLGSGEPGDAEYRLRRDTGGWRRVLTRWRVERDDSAQPSRLVGVVLDISELRQATEAVAELREQLHLAADAAEIGTFSWLLTSDQLTWSARAKEHFWQPPEAEISIERFYSLVLPADRDHVRAAVERTLLKGAPYDIEFRVASPEGAIRWIHAKGRAYHDRAGRPTRFDGITVDVTRQKHVETKLHESEALYRLVIDSLHDYAIFLLDDQGCVTHWNAGAQRLLGFTEDEILGRPGRIIFTPEDQARGEPEKELTTAKGTGRASDDRWHVRSDGSLFFATGLMTALADAQGRHIGFAKIMRDITDRHTATAERERLLESERLARAEAERTSRLKDEFLATLSHELRTPLNAILGWTQVLKESSNDPAEIAEGLDIIDRNTRVQAQLIEDLLDMSRIISGKVRLDVRRVDLAGVIQAAIDSVRTAANAKDIRLQAHLPAERLHVMGDRTRLQQVAWNLLSNAIKFTPNHGAVDVFLVHENSQAVLRVRDNGAGIAPDFLPHVFERFRQADASTTRQHGGLGLGLSIVKHLVELHGGEVRAESAGPGQGATFIASIPILPAPPTRETPTSDARRVSREPPRVVANLSGIKVLVVEDEPDSANLVKRVLENHGAQVHTAASVGDALDLFRRVQPNILLSDIGMPHHDGYELIRRVRGLPGGVDVPAAALSALARPQDVERALNAGFRTHLAKPVEPAELVSAVASLAGLAS